MNKIIGVISGLFGEKNVGGAELQLYYLSREFASMGYEVHVFTSNQSECDKDEMMTEGLILHLLPSKPIHTSTFKLNFLWRVWKGLVKVKPDICLIRTATLAPLVLAYTKAYSKKFIYSATHDKDCLIRKITGLGSLYKALWRRLFQLSIKHADAVIAQTEYQKEQFKENFGIESIVIGNGHSIPTATILKAEPPIILWLANLRREKRIDLFVELAQRLNDKKCLLVVAGKPMDVGCLEVLEEGIKKQENLRYVGALSVDQALELVGKAYMLVNTSDNEGFPNTFIEAWMRKTPTISLTVDPDNLIKKNGMGFHSGSFENMVRDIKILLENKPLLLEMGENAYKYAIEHHDIKKIAKEYVEILI